MLLDLIGMEAVLGFAIDARLDITHDPTWIRRSGDLRVHAIALVKAVLGEGPRD